MLSSFFSCTTGSFGFHRNENLEGNIITTTRSHSDYTITKTVQACEPTEVLRVGGAGHKVNQSPHILTNTKVFIGYSTLLLL